MAEASSHARFVVRSGSLMTRSVESDGDRVNAIRPIQDTQRSPRPGIGRVERPRTAIALASIPWWAPDHHLWSNLRSPKSSGAALACHEIPERRSLRNRARPPTQPRHADADAMTPFSTVTLRHNKVDLALHLLRRAPAERAGTPPLLLLHGLGGQSPDGVPAAVAAWPGAIWGLDFTGHGRSSVPKGGGYTCELLVADADIALDHLGPAALYGTGLGGYVGVLLAGARPAAVRGVVVVDGPGLDGGGPCPETAASAARTKAPAAAPSSGPPDPYALEELSTDVRSAAYAAGYARQAVAGSDLARPVIVCAAARPPWLAAVVAEAGVEQAASPAQAVSLMADPGVRPPR